MVSTNGNGTASLRRIIFDRGIDASQMERMLSHIPIEPLRATVGLLGPFDYSSAYSQIGDLVEGIDLEPRDAIPFSMKNPTKEKILKVYKQMINIHRVDPGKLLAMRKIFFKDAYWWVPEERGQRVRRNDSPGVTIQLDRFVASVKVIGQTPDYVNDMQQDLSRRVSVEVEQPRTDGPGRSRVIAPYL